MQKPWALDTEDFCPVYYNGKPHAYGQLVFSKFVFQQVVGLLLSTALIVINNHISNTQCLVTKKTYANLHV